MVEQTQANVETVKEPSVFIGIPTGPSKEYAIHLMVAMLRNIDYKNHEIHWAVTKFQNKKRQSRKFVKKLETLMKTVDWPIKWFIHTTELTDEEVKTPYVAIAKNKQLLRDIFLDGNHKYFLLLGGDNPPRRDTIKRLLKLDADAAMAVCYQRPHYSQVHPLLWKYIWTVKDLEKFNLEPELLEALKDAWLNCTMMFPIEVDKNWKKHKSISNVTGGDGCTLVKREVLEYVDWGIPHKAYHSEDVHWMNIINWNGFTVKVDPQFHAPHFDESGRIM